MTSTAVILVAGIGSRLRPLTEDRPKALVDVGGETILQRALRLLAAHGVRKVVLATGYREDAVRRALKDTPLEIAYCMNPEFDRTQNSVSLMLCRDAVGSGAFFKLDGDVLFQSEVLKRLESSHSPLAVAVDERRVVDAEAMKVRVSGDQILAFGKHIPLQQSAGESIGIERISAEFSGPLFEALGHAHAAGRHDLYYEDVYSELIERGVVTAQAVQVGDLPWTEVDNFEDLERARRLVGG